ncbi:wall-associated receptor kinase-like 14 [Brachypodium distachyon]|uniref:Protein kinase domain-containing protein n=1 Tax=Brachypodium distachyon TaxID=15368 RepID=I1IGV5_BRADI|nr:wall-associated receptor kinase-like 14 [Brachypodium distachyon]XP_024310860.1 wall-associated receptor kinase-like 14 [Brachypodium distachyon]XP_024310861.1 wall-associated receptor kinase-like 14 [Brachypodium distachyon]XP_024310862.1 wall-associated receptor kinase-like 14 [Brachypodium distachyon]KQJ86007.1 hypothetical protein BRADI_4g02850v3 [Brachypodium distachyon]|eukprot:XP_014758820.1 wall-associated receptor kinase-like 14 [Brachypodium distachyon]
MRRLVAALLLAFASALLLPHGRETFSAAANITEPCNRRCGGGGVPYPFGFSAGCPIPLSCDDANSSALLNATHTTAPCRVVSFNSSASTVVVSLPPSCDRTVEQAKAALSGANYGVSARTGLFLRGGGCRAWPNASACSVPAGVMSRLLRNAQCIGNDTSAGAAAGAVACVASAAQNATAETFLSWDKAEKTKCDDLLTSAVYMDAEDQGAGGSLEFGVAELGWWLNGTCAAAGRCAANATCTDVRTPGNTAGHRCACEAGLEGDGFSAGDGCYLRAKRGRSKKTVAIIGGVLASVTVAAASVLLLCWAQRRRSGCYGRSDSNRSAAKRLLSEAAASSGVPVYSYNEMARATSSFSHTHRLGTGAYGTVYVGRLPTSSPVLVAIKRLRCRHDDDDDDGKAVSRLLNEIKLISSLSHPNLVRLLGCCLDRGEQILVYEFVPNGTLSHHLIGGGNGGVRLLWRARLRVAAGIAAAVAYLHAARPPILHRDIKSSNILLGTDLRAKLADFGLSRVGAGLDLSSTRSHVSTAPQGTPGYVDPEYHQSFHLSDKSDVYSFGVVLLELITAMKVVDLDRPPNEVNLASLALDRIGKGRVHEIVDPVLLVENGGEEWVMESVRHVSELAFRCLAFDKDVRPSMSEVAAELCRIRDTAPDSRLDRPMTEPIDGVGFDGLATTVKKSQSPVSVQEVWISDQSLPSSNGSMPRFQ